MYDINSACANYELSWFAKRFNALLVDFPNELTPQILSKDSLCANYDSSEAYESLKYAYAFLTTLISELLILPLNGEKEKHIKKVFTKIDLIWGLCYYGEVIQEGNEYCLIFNKISLKKHRDTLPSNYGISLNNINENGCYTEFFKNDKAINSFKSCDKGILHFDDKLTALGLYLFVQKVLQKRWYQENDIAGSYTKVLAFEPVKYCTEPFYRADMRIFICGERLKFDFYEHLSGYNETQIGYFKIIYEFIKINYPQCLPAQGFFKYISCSVNFLVDNEHRMLGQIGVGGSEHELGFYTGLKGKEMICFLKRIDEFELKVIGNSLIEVDDKYVDDKNCKQIFYRDKPYIFRNVKTKEFRFSITSLSDVKQVMKIMEIKAECKQNTI